MTRLEKDYWCKTGQGEVRRTFIVPVGKLSPSKAKKTLKAFLAKFKDNPLPEDVMIVKKAHTE